MHVIFSRAEYERTLALFEKECAEDAVLKKLKGMRKGVTGFLVLGLLLLPVSLFIVCIPLFFWVVIDGLVARRKKAIKDQYLIL